jgi:hypothetical protein
MPAEFCPRLVQFRGRRDFLRPLRLSLYPSGGANLPEKRGTGLSKIIWMGTSEMKLLSGILALTLTSVAALSSANAADMYVAPAASGGYKDGPAYVAPWTGFYLGGHVGAAWGQLEITDVDGLNASPGQKFSLSDTALIGGG